MTYRQKRFEFCVYILVLLLYGLSLCFDNAKLSTLLYKILFTAQVISFIAHAFSTEIMRNNIFRKILTICGAFLVIGAIYVLSRTTRIWHTFKFETFIILLMGLWQVLYMILTTNELIRLKKTDLGYFNDDFTKTMVEEEQEKDDDENWVNKKFW